MGWISWFYCFGDLQSSGIGAIGRVAQARKPARPSFRQCYYRLPASINTCPAACSEPESVPRGLVDQRHLSNRAHDAIDPGVERRGEIIGHYARSKSGKKASGRDSKLDADVVAFLKSTDPKPKRTSVQAPWQNGIF